MKVFPQHFLRLRFECFSQQIDFRATVPRRNRLAGGHGFKYCSHEPDKGLEIKPVKHFDQKFPILFQSVNLKFQGCFPQLCGTGLIIQGHATYIGG